MASNTKRFGSDFQPRVAIPVAVLAFLAGSAVTLAQSQPAATPVQDAVAAEVQNSEQQPADPANPDESQVSVDDTMTVDLHVKDEDLANVLEMLSIQSQKNIIASKDVQARVTANLYGVTFYEALDAVLNVNGYGYLEEGNFIKIYTLDELQKIEQAARLKVSKVLPLNYLSAVDAAEFVKPLLSPEGQIKVPGKTVQFPTPAEVPLGGEDYAQAGQMVVFDFEENVAQVEELIKQLDTRPMQVLVEATILQTQLNEANALGVDFSLLADLDFAEFLPSGPLGAVNNLIAGQNPDGGKVPIDNGGSSIVQTVGNTLTGKAGVKVGIVSNDVAVFIRALDEVTDTTVLSNPKIIALNRQPSRVLVGRKVGYLNTTTTDTSTTQSVEFLDTGTQLYFRPFVSNDGKIRMELKPQVSEAAIREITDVQGSAVTIPDEITNELTTNVLVRDGQTIVLGGLFRESTTSTRKQVPLLGDIPILGYAFRGHDDDITRNEILFLVKPTIMNDAVVDEAAGRGKEYVGRVLAGAREGTLFFSRSKMTANRNLEADRLAREGQTDRALNLIKRSLRLDPHQAEMIAMRERLSGTKTPVMNRSFLERVYNKSADETAQFVRSDQSAEPAANFENFHAQENASFTADPSFDPNEHYKQEPMEPAQDDAPAFDDAEQQMPAEEEFAPAFEEPVVEPVIEPAQPAEEDAQPVEPEMVDPQDEPQPEPVDDSVEPAPQENPETMSTTTRTGHRTRPSGFSAHWLAWHQHLNATKTAGRTIARN